jgi:hypothetical protein
MGEFVNAVRKALQEGRRTTCAACNLPAKLRAELDEALRALYPVTVIQRVLREAGHVISASALTRHRDNHVLPADNQTSKPAQ